MTTCRPPAATNGSAWKRLRPKAVLSIACACFVLIAAAIYARANFGSSSDPRQPLKVATVLAKEQSEYQISRWFAGRIEARQRVELASELAGKVGKVFVDEGSQVTAGDIIVELDRKLLNIEKAQLQSQLVGIDAELKLADLRLTRQSNLKKDGFSSEDTIDAIEAQITNLNASRRTLFTRIEEVAIRLDKSIIRAPFSASVQTRLVDVGAVINAGTPLLELLERTAAEVKVGVPSEVARKFSVGQIHPVETDSERFEAKVISIAPAVDLATQTVAVRLQLLNELNRPKFGEYVQLEITSNVKKAGFWIPNSALIEGERGLWNIYSVGENQQVHKHTINILYVDNERSFVAASIADNTVIIKSGLNRVTPGMQVSF